MRPLLKIRANMMLLLYIQQVLAPFLSTMHNLPPLLVIKFKIWSTKQWSPLQNINDRRMSNSASLYKISLPPNFPTLMLSFYRTCNMLKCQCLELLIFWHLHLHMYLNHPPYLPLLNLYHNPWLQYHHQLHPLHHPLNLLHHCHLKTGDDVLQFSIFEPFLLMTKGGELEILIVMKNVLVNKRSLEVFPYIFSFTCYLLYSVVIFIIFGICHFLAMLELRGSLIALDSLL